MFEAWFELPAHSWAGQGELVLNLTNYPNAPTRTAYYHQVHAATKLHLSNYGSQGGSINRPAQGGRNLAVLNSRTGCIEMF